MKPNSTPLHRHPRTETEKQIAEVWSKYLGVADISCDANFFDLGGDSLLTQQVCDAINKQYKLQITATQLFQYPTIALLSEHLFPTKEETTSFQFPLTKKKKRTTEAIAIIGMAGKFPGAANLKEFWELLKEGKETISFFKAEELDPSIPSSLKNNPNYVKARGIVASAKTFDASFFKINQKLAEIMDPQIRLFLEITWEVLESTGYLPEHFNGSIGVYAGNGPNSYYKDNVLANKTLMEQVGSAQARYVNEDFIATRTAYHLNLTGPAVTVQSACSTSLLAVSQAVEALRNGHCDVALAGGSSVTAPIHSGHLYQEGAILSSDGHCRPFDAQAKGTIFSDGAGVVLLKPLDLAQQDGDTIHGVIKGIGISNDGGNKGSFSAPNSEGQAVAIHKALTDAKVNPLEISYVEAHGTATPMGDPIEIEGLKLAFGKQKNTEYCALGSLKSNMGHLLAASGVAGLIKTILALKHQQIPASLGFESPNPAIDFKNSPFYVNTTLKPWNVKGTRLAGVSSFGVGGTNVHVIVEEYQPKEIPSKNARPFQLLSWSAKTQNSLLGYESALMNFLHSSPETNIADIAYTLHTTRASFQNRSFIVATNPDDAKDIISKKDRIKSAALEVAPSHMGFLFPGQGSQFLQMGKTLYDQEKVYREAVDTCAALLMDDLKLDIRDIIFPKTNSPEAEDRIKDTRFTQPALFVTEYALSQLWMHWGIIPNVLCGHSIGEFVAAHLAGVLNLEEALHLIAVRGRLVSSLPAGSMLSVRLPEKDLLELLPKTLSIAAINSKHLCVVSGNDLDIEAFAKTLESKDIPNRILITSHAFHSIMMEPILDAFKEEVDKTTLKTPKIPIVSSVTGTWMTNEDVTSSTYWVNHLRQTVRFSDAIDTILALDNPILLEVGPGKALATLAHQQGNGKTVSVFSSLVLPGVQDNTYQTLLDSLGNLWLKGVAIDWHGFYATETCKKVSLPSYVFDRKPCWIAPIPYNNQPTPNQTIPVVPHVNPQIEEVTVATGRPAILEKVSKIIYDISGITFEPDAYSKHFLELGLDSLTLTQVSLRIKNTFNLPISFRQLNEDLVSLELVTSYLVKNLPEDLTSVQIDNSVKHPSAQTNHVSTTYQSDVPLHQEPITMAYLAEKLELLSQQIATLQNAQISLNNNPSGIHNIPSESLNTMGVTQHGGLDTQNLLASQTPEAEPNKNNYTILSEQPPTAGAKLGRDEHGNPAWYVEDSNEKGRYIKINL